jgi:ArsR family transcriptional regulator, cadmium/lead-responsive transcriptional repressor
MQDEINFVKASKYRTKIMKTLEGNVKIPSQIAKDSDINRSHISDILSQLKEYDLVECVNPEVRKGRLYRLTKKGEILARNL